MATKKDPFRCEKEGRNLKDIVKEMVSPVENIELKLVDNELWCIINGNVMIKPPELETKIDGKKHKFQDTSALARAMMGEKNLNKFLDRMRKELGENKSERKMTNKKVKEQTKNEFQRKS